MLLSPFAESSLVPPTHPSTDPRTRKNRLYTIRDGLEPEKKMVCVCLLFVDESQTEQWTKLGGSFVNLSGLWLAKPIERD